MGRAAVPHCATTGLTSLADLFLDAPLVAHDAEDQLQALWRNAQSIKKRPLLGRMLTRFLPLASVPDPMAALFASDERPEPSTYFEATWRVSYLGPVAAGHHWSSQPTPTRR